MDTLFLIKNRKIITAFNDKDVPADILAEILNCARVTPTKNYPQEWKFVVIKNKETKEKISTLSNINSMADANTVVAIFSKNNKFKLEYTSAATEAMLIAANHYNLGTNWQATYGEPYSKNISTLLNAPSDYYLMGIVAIGYYDFITPNYQNVSSLSQMVVNEKF